MKKSLNIATAIFSIVVIAALTVSARSVKQTDNDKKIPENIMKIAQKSCVKCHTKPEGKSMAISKLNLGEWSSLSETKQAEKANKMCEMVTKEKMPPKKFRESNPNDVPTKEEITAFCDWAHSLQADKK